MELVYASHSATFAGQPLKLHRGGWRFPTQSQWTLFTLVLLIVNGLSFWRANAPSPHIADTLWELASQPLSEPRGIVLPLFDGIDVLGLSLVMEIRALDIDLPIEIPHCGDLSESFVTQLQQNASLASSIRVYDVCRQAADATEIDANGNPRPLFCESLADCHRRFRSFDIKVLALLFSQFHELMLLDADVLFLQSPMSLWELPKFTSTGTLFFNDRISFTDKFLAQRITTAWNRSELHEFVETFDREPYERLRHVPRRGQEPTRARQHVRSRGEPSAYLASTHAWNLRAGHHADSSLMLWSKTKQPRATAILGSFISLRYAHRPPSYGDKELYFLACEVADSAYAFSDFGVGSIGVDARTEDGVLCGDALHFFPERRGDDGADRDASPLYINSDHIASWRLDAEPLYRTNARPASHFPGSFEQKQLAQECPFDVTMQQLSARDVSLLQRRQQFYRMAETLVVAANVDEKR
jgi:hypothetical protein